MRPYKYYTDEQISTILKDYVIGKLPLRELNKKYKDNFNAKLYKWLKKAGIKVNNDTKGNNWEKIRKDVNATNK